MKKQTNKSHFIDLRSLSVQASYCSGVERTKRLKNQVLLGIQDVACAVLASSEV